MGTEWIKHGKGRDLNSYHKTRSLFNWQMVAVTLIGESGVSPTITYIVSVQGPPELYTVGGLFFSSGPQVQRTARMLFWERKFLRISQFNYAVH